MGDVSWRLVIGEARPKRRRIARRSRISGGRWTGFSPKRVGENPVGDFLPSRGPRSNDECGAGCERGCRTHLELVDEHRDGEEVLAVIGRHGASETYTRRFVL